MNEGKSWPSWSFLVVGVRRGAWFPAEYTLSFHNPNTLLLGLNAVNRSNKTFLPSTVISTSSPHHRFHPPATSALPSSVPECGCHETFLLRNNPVCAAQQYILAFKMIALKCEFPLLTARSNQICSYKCAMRKKSWKAESILPCLLLNIHIVFLHSLHK